MLRAERSAKMPWQETSTMSLRREFCALASREGANVSELCRRFGISRKTGYKWLARYRAEGAAGLEDRSRRPQRMPRLTDPAGTARVLALRDRHPTWGGRKLRRRLQDLGEAAPAASTIAQILRRADRLDPAEAPRHTAWQRFEAEAANELWQLDFKGDFALASGRCHPLHLLDDHSRFVLGLVACPDQRQPTVQAALTTVFRRYGLPWRLLCDNGAPWGSVQAEGGLTALGAWLVRLGIRVVHGRPYHPQTQGKLERVNRTLAADVLATPRYPDLAACQRAFDAWRACYNHERPHEALGLATPITRYAVSPRPFP
jgi:transposase InsO family protein